VVTDVLVVCEANQARSPVLARLLEREADRRGWAGLVTVVDAGLRAEPGEPVLPTVLRAARDLDLGLEEHRATLLDPDAEHELVLTMTEDQRYTLVRRRPQELQRTFTVPEVLRLLRSRRWDPRWEGTPAVVEHLHRIRPLVAPASRPEDVADPARGGRRLAGSVVSELRSASRELARALWGPVPGSGAGQTSTVGR
jgi:protein-tyrosine phosphatase